MANSINEKNSNSSDSEIQTMSAPAKAYLSRGPPPFEWSSLWSEPVVNPLNGKSYTLPLLSLSSSYSRNFHLSWLGFFVAFLSWFAFPPLLAESIKVDLQLTPAQIGNSNIVALCATLIVRLFVGPLVDRYGPRKVMASVLIVGAIPSGLAGTVTSVNGLYVIRFFIGILGATFVPCLAWTTAFFDKNIVGTANGLVGGWGNMGGGVTFIVMVALFQSLVDQRGFTPAAAWRTSFAVVPVPILLFVAFITLYYGTDCPAGDWSARHTLPASAIAAKMGHLSQLDPSERRVVESKMAEKTQARTTVQEAKDDDDEILATSDLDIAVAEVLTWSSAMRVFTSSGTWLCALAYMTTFGFELAVDSNLPNALFNSHRSDPSFGQETAGYYAAVFGLLNLFTRPLGGVFGDMIYVRYGVAGKKWLTLSLGFLQGAFSLGLGLWQRAEYASGRTPDLGIQMLFVVLMACACELANGANFALVPHCNAFNNGFMTAIVGAFGNVGGILMALMFRFFPTQAFSQAWWVAGVFCMAVNALLGFLPVPKY